MAGNHLIQRAIQIDERRGDSAPSPVVQSDKQQRLEGTSTNAQRKFELQAQAQQRLYKRRVTEGNAGGFFDRQDANDRKQWDSDEEEFDDFGRRKKRKKDGTPMIPRRREAKPEVDTPLTEAVGSTFSTGNATSSEEMPPPAYGERVEGIVRWYESQKAFGFVRTPGIDVDIYFKDPDRTLAPVEGMKVTFVLRKTPDGKPQARDIIRGGLAAAVAKFEARPMTPPMPSAIGAAMFADTMSMQPQMGMF
mmetsp:Transcript_24578/g.39449  ORF Transcript_24578/g.39449 Transcript_24578/m.39449 type:complete len:249 (+) Transcript_24578:61-807(+)